MSKAIRKYLGLPCEKPKKIKTEEDMLNWFADRHVDVHVALDVVDCRVFHRLCKRGIFIFDHKQKEYYVAGGIHGDR